MTFWTTATIEAKLAQIDGGIELRMTTGQVAMNCGTNSVSVRGFAHRHGRSFSQSERKKPWANKPRKRAKVKSSRINHTEDYDYD